MTTTTSNVLVLKLGGSLAESGRLAATLAIAARANRPVVIVPGGGPFADTVRQLQPEWALSDALAHKLALLAMHQMGLVIASHHTRFKPCQTLEAIRDAVAQGIIAVWLPITLQYTDHTLPADWTVTSDALAARLAERLGDAEVALVKSCVVPDGASLARLAAEGITDPAFADVVSRAGLSWHVYGAGSEPDLAQRLATPPQ